jgi:hypothetical protein
MRSIFSSYVKNILMMDTFFLFIAIIDKFSNFNNSNDGHFWGVANRKDKYDKARALVARTTPLFSNFLFTNLFSIKYLYFFIISFFFPYFNLSVSIFIQSYVNIKLHVSTLYRY